MSVPHPIPYQGSKRNLAPHILRYFPASAERLIEPFAGSAAISLAALNNRKVNRVIIGDIDAPLIALWQQIACSPDALTDAYTAIWNAQLGQERRYYDHIRSAFNTTHRPDYYLFLLARCVKAAVRYNTNGEFNQSPDNRRKGTRPTTMRKSIVGASNLLKARSEFHACDYRMLLDQATTNDIIYLDPPYQGICKNGDPRYKEKIAFDNFVEALGQLNDRQIPYLVSYDGRTEKKTYGELLPAFLKLERIELAAGRSSQATLLGRNEKTYESLYLSPELASMITQPSDAPDEMPAQLALFETA